MQERDFGRVMREAGTCFAHGGKSIPCTFGSTDDDYQLAPDGGGALAVYALVMTTTRRHFCGGEFPKKGEVIEADGQAYVVARTNARPGSPLVKIYCANPDVS